MSARFVASRVIVRVLDGGQSLSEALETELPALPGRERALAQALSYGTVRWHGRLQALLAQLLSRPLKRRDQDIAYVIEMGLFELLYQRTPAYAVTAEVTELARVLGKPWAVGLINGILRRVVREQDALCAQLDQNPQVRHAMPSWLYARLAASYPQHLAALLTAINAHPPMTLRVNLARTTRDEYLQRLQAAGLAASAHSGVASAVSLQTPVDVQQLPGFAEGEVSVQDAAAQLAAGLLACQPGMRVLDVCAAPGGKTAHLLESVNGALDLTALDIDPQRLARIEAYLTRLGYRATVRCGDGQQPAPWWSGEVFERILLDVPCSATGVMRRHPDIKWLRRASDIEALATTQQNLLEAVWPLLAPNGVLLYATCSLLEQENEANLAAFVARHADAQVLPITADWGIALPLGRQILTGDQGMDGFYYARLQKARSLAE